MIPKKLVRKLIEKQIEAIKSRDRAKQCVWFRFCFVFRFVVYVFENVFIGFSKLFRGIPPPKLTEAYKNLLETYKKHAKQNEKQNKNKMQSTL